MQKRMVDLPTKLSSKKKNQALNLGNPKSPSWQFYFVICKRPPYFEGLGFIPWEPTTFNF